MLWNITKVVINVSVWLAAAVWAQRKRCVGDNVECSEWSPFFYQEEVALAGTQFTGSIDSSQL